MMGDRLEEYTKKADPPFLFAFAGYSSSIGNIDEYEAIAYGSPDKITEAVSVLSLENRRALLHGFNESELARAKASILTSVEKSLLEKDQRESSSHAMSLVSLYLRESPYLSAA